MYREKITVCDCTIRDGGLMNNSNFSMEVVAAVYKAICASGIQIVELGYRNSRKMFDPKVYGPWRFCDDDLLKQVTDGVETRTRLAVMMDAHKCDIADIKPKADSVVDMIRVATYVKDVDKAIFVANAANDLGYETTINIMAISHTKEWELEEALAQIELETRVAAVYIVDSFGSLYSEDIDRYYDIFARHIQKKEIGVHCHNNQQLGFANTIEGIIKGANWLDGTLYGMGRGAGNCPTELLIGFLKNPRYRIEPIVEVIGKYLVAMQREIEWGYSIPYMLTGILNQRPDEPLKLMALDRDDPRRSDYAGFYRELSEPPVGE